MAKERMIDYMARLDRNAIIEECAREIEILMAREDIDVMHWPARLRALKDKP